MNPRPTVLHVLAPAREGGLERVVQMLAAGQEGRVTVAAVLTPSDAPDHPVVRSLRAQGTPTAEVVAGARDYFGEYRAIRRLIKEMRPAVVHTHGYRADVIAGFAARGLGTAVVTTLHGFVGGHRNRMNERVQVWSAKRADAVIAVSKPLKDFLASRGVHPGRLHLIANAFSPGESLSRADARARLGLAPAELVAAWVGRLSAEKGPDVMVRAMVAAPEPWRLSVIGSGRDRVALESLALELGIANRLTWHGSVANAGTMLAAFDALVLSSRTEGTPIILLEAMDAGVPIVATRVGGVPDVVRESEAMLVPSEDPGAIGAALRAIQGDAAAARMRAAAAKERVASVYSPDRWIAAIDDVYRAAIKSRRG